MGKGKKGGGGGKGQYFFMDKSKQLRPLGTVYAKQIAKNKEGVNKGELLRKLVKEKGLNKIYNAPVKKIPAYSNLQDKKSTVSKNIDYVQGKQKVL